MAKKAFRKPIESFTKSRRRLYQGKKKPCPGKQKHPSLSPNKRKGGKQAHCPMLASRLRSSHLPAGHNLHLLVVTRQTALAGFLV